MSALYVCFSYGIYCFLIDNFIQPLPSIEYALSLLCQSYEQSQTNDGLAQSQRDIGELVYSSMTPRYEVR